MAVIPGGDALAAAQNQIAATAPATRLVAVTPSNTVDLADVARALYVAVSGNVAIVARDDADNVGNILPVTAGQTLPIMTRRVLSTGTTATVVAML